MLQITRNFLTLLIAGWLLSACATSTPHSDWGTISEQTLAPCQPPSPLASGSHQELEAWAVAQGFKYRECSDRQAELSDKVRVRQSAETQAAKK